MANELKIASGPSLTVYAHIINRASQIWNGATFETYSSANWANYTVSMTEQGASGVYVGNFPAGITSTDLYEIFYYQQDGGSESESADRIIGTGAITWNGSGTAATSTPTLALLVAEGLAKAGESSPSDSLTARAQDKWMEEIKNDIWRKAKTLKSLQRIKGIVFNKGQSRYSMPSDFAGQGEVSIRLLDGANVGSLQTAGGSTATLAASFSATEDYMIGKEIVITAGTGIYEVAQVTAWDNTTKVATVSPSWGTTPAASDSYIIVESYSPLEEGPVWNFDMARYPNVRRRPGAFYPVGDVDYSEIMLDSPPDKTYGGIVRYYVNIMTVDLSSTLMATLYQKYRSVWVQGIFAKRLEDIDDDRAGKEMQRYYSLISELAAYETYGADLSNLQAVVSD